MLPSGFEIAIRSSLGVWTDVTSVVQSMSDGTSSEAQVVPEISLTFTADVEDLGDLLDPEIDPDLARIRVTHGSDIRYYLLEEHSGSVTAGTGYRLPSVTGRAWAGRIVDWPLLTYVWPVDALASTIASQCCVLKVDTQSGAAIPVSWQATLDPTIPGKVYEVVKKGRLEILNELAAACGARVRVSLDGLGFEVVDVLRKTLSGSALRHYGNALSLSYSRERCHRPENAVRVKGERDEVATGRLPVIKVVLFPSTIKADEVSTATARAQVFAETGLAVSHETITDESIDANSYTTIPVSGCYSVQGVWLNTGTQPSPVKGARIDPTSFTASAITVPTQSTDLFIVSYTQAESVSWSLTDYADTITGEAQSSTGALTVVTTENIGSVSGVYRATDTNRTGTNFYTGGSFTPNTTTITLGISPGATGTALVIDYSKYNGAPLSASLSPSSSLCDANGFATTTIGSGDVMGVAVIEASALGQSGTANLSLTGEAVAAMTLSATPKVIRKKVTGTTVYETVAAEVSEVALQADVNGRNAYVIDLDYPIAGVNSLDVTGYPAASVSYWTNDSDSGIYRLWLNGALLPGSPAVVGYVKIVTVSESADESTIEVNATQADGTPVTDGTAVSFEVVAGQRLETVLSASSATTSAGKASVTLEAGDYVGLVTIRAICGGLHADVVVEITDANIDTTASGSSNAPGQSSWSDSDNADSTQDGKDCVDVPQDSNDSDGSVSGRRKLVDCDGAPIAYENVTLYTADGTAYGAMTDANGYFWFTSGSAGENKVVVRGEEYSFTISDQGSAGRGGWRSDCG